MLGRIQILLLQEVVTEVGLFFDTRYDWTIVYGKKEGTWRGEGILYHKQQGMHHHSQLHTHAISTTIRCPHTLDLATPTFHPYNTTMQSRRLDYLFVRSRRGVGAGGGAKCAMGSETDHCRQHGSRLPTPAGEIGGPAC